MHVASHLIAAAALVLASTTATAQTRSLAQDPALDNLKHPPGYRAAAPNALGDVIKGGTGPRAMILIPGLGFGASVFTELAARHGKDFTTYAVTLPGFAGTPAPAMPPADSAAYAQAAWTRSAMRGILALMDRERIGKATIVAQWILASQIALQLAIEHPDRVERVVLISGVAKSYYDNDTTMLTWSLAQRSRYAEAMGARWFRTVTRRTWDDNNFMSYDYAVQPLRGLFLWREAADASLAVWVRYLLEFYAMDVTTELARLRAPVLVVQPGFDDPAFYVEPGRNYMRNLTQDSWRGVGGRVERVTVPGSRLFVMYDQPELLDRAMRAFLARPD